MAVVETGSFVAAANSLRWPRATLRRRVDELEASAGVALLNRSEQGATPTPAGELMARRGREILVGASALLSSVREVGAAPAGTVRVALPVGLPPKMLTLLSATIRATHPALRLQVRFAEDPLSLLPDVDAAFCFGDEPPEGPWVSHEILRLEMRLLASPRYLAARGTPTTLEELQAHDLLVWTGPERQGSRLPLRRGGHVAVTPTVASCDAHVLRLGASEDLGIVFSPDGRLPDDFMAGPELVPVLDDVVGCVIAFRLVFPAALPEMRRLVVAIDQLRAMVIPAPFVPRPASS
jgi:DNA-binding transcriptional LysR family regulator